MWLIVRLRSGAREKTRAASEIGNGHSVLNPRRQDFRGIVQQPAGFPIKTSRVFDRVHAKGGGSFHDSRDLDI
jgi:hypothetical protein